MMADVAAAREYFDGDRERDNKGAVAGRNPGYKIFQDKKLDFFNRLVVHGEDLSDYFDNELVFGASTDFEVDLLSTARIQDVGYMRMIMQLRGAWITCDTDKVLENLLREDTISVAEVQLYVIALTVRYRQLTEELWVDRGLVFYNLYLIENDAELDSKRKRSLSTKFMMEDLTRIQIHKAYQAMLQIMKCIRLMLLRSRTQRLQDHVQNL